MSDDPCPGAYARLMDGPRQTSANVVQAGSWRDLVSATAPIVWDHAVRRGARWQAIDASEAAFLNLADGLGETGDSDVETVLLAEADEAMRLVQAATWRTPRPIIVNDDGPPASLTDTATRAVDLRIDDSTRFAVAETADVSGGADVVVPWRDGGDGFGGALISWFRRYALDDQRLDVSLLTDSARRVLLHPTPEVEDCWVRTPGGPLVLDRDDLGYWRGIDVPEVPLSFAVARAGGGVVTTEWVTV